MIRIFLAMLLLLPLVSRADGSDPRPEMHALVQEITSLERYVLSESQFLDPKNDAAIRKSLGTMSSHLGELGKGTFATDPALKANLALLTSHINDADRFFKEGNKSFSRFMLQSSLQMCIACHTRGKVNVDFSVPEDVLKAATPLDRGDFLFATRQFDKGREAYESVVEGYPANKTGPFNLRKAILALAVYYARVKEDPKAGYAYFSNVAARDDLPTYLRKEVKSWSEDFGQWSKEKVKTKPQSESELVAAAKKLLRSDDFSLVGETDRRFHIRRLRASALLHKALEAPGEKSPAKAEALLYLGQIYHRVQHQLFFRFGEMYLKACINDYPKTRESKDCYLALEQAVTEGYTGSAGTDIPEDEQVELMRLKRLAF
jgi:hypothetical protein